MPNVVGEEIEAGVAAIEDSELQVEVIDLELEDAEGADPGSIVSQTPDPSVNVEPGSVVVLRASPTLIKVPAVVGLDASTAEQELLDLGLDVVQETTRTSAQPAGDVWRSQPHAGTAVEFGSTVTLFIVEDPPPPEPDPPPEPEPATHTVTVRLEMWAEWYSTDGEARCAGSQYGLLAEMRRGQTVSLLGPDGGELSAVLLDDGFIEESRLDDERETPPQVVCAWDLSFPDAPEVATYRLDFPHGGVSGSISLSEARQQGWHLGIVWWS